MGPTVCTVVHFSGASHSRRSRSTPTLQQRLDIMWEHTDLNMDEHMSRGELENIYSSFDVDRKSDFMLLKQLLFTLDLYTE
jgi:hypothetical protein